MTTTVLALKRISGNNIVSPIGFKATGIHCGIKHKKNDLALLVSEVPANVAGVFTTNAIQAAPLIVTKEAMQQTGKMQAIIVNSGNANACTGQQGIERCTPYATKNGRKAWHRTELVGVASTGVIGEIMKMDRL